MPLMVIFPVTFETCKKCGEIKIKIVIIEVEKFLLHESKARFHSTYSMSPRARTQYRGGATLTQEGKHLCCLLLCSKSGTVRVCLT